MAVHGRDRYYVGEVCELDLGYDTVALLVPLMPRTFLSTTETALPALIIVDDVTTVTSLAVRAQP
jgi:hypothetical protein